MTRVHGLLLIVLLTTLAPWLRAGEAVVHAVLFYSPTCPHCHKVIEEHLIPLQEKYGERLAILGINIFRPEGRRLYAKAMGHFGIPDEDRGVPALIVGTALLQGDREIPESFPGIVNQGLILGGIDWPLIAGLQQLLEAQGLVAPAAKAAEAVEPTSSPAVDKSTAEHDLQKALRARPTLADKWARDPVGNSLALAVLAGMLFSIVFLGYRATLPTARPIPWPRWSIPALLPIGLGVAAYLSFVEVNQVAAVCGPVGDCNAVQQSSYAHSLRRHTHCGSRAGGLRRHRPCLDPAIFRSSAVAEAWCPRDPGANDHEVVATPRKMKDAARETAQRGR